MLQLWEPFDGNNYCDMSLLFTNYNYCSNEGYFLALSNFRIYAPLL